MVLWKQSTLVPAEPSADFRGSVYVHPSVRGDDGGRPGVVAAHSIDLSDGSLDIDGGEGPERRLGGCLLLQTPPSHPLGRCECRCILYVLAFASIPIKLDRRGRQGGRLELLKWGWAKVSLEKDGLVGKGRRTLVSSRHSKRRLVTPRPDYISSCIPPRPPLFPSFLRRTASSLQPPRPSPF